MKEKIKNFLLKIKKYFNEKFVCSRLKLILFALLCIVITAFCNLISFTAKGYCFNETHTEQIEDSPQTESIIIDRDIKGANPTQSDYLNNIGAYDGAIYFNTNKTYAEWLNIFDSLTFYNASSFGINTNIYPLACNSNTIAEGTYGLWFESNTNASFYLTFADLYSRTFIYIAEITSNSLIVADKFYWDYAYLHPLLENVLPIGTQNQLLWDFVSTKPFETSSTDIDTSILTLNETNFDRAVHFSTFLTKETIAGYFSQLTYETTNFITPSLTLNGVDSYTIITGRIGSVPISNYIPSLVVVKYESKYVVYNYLRDNYLTPIYDTSTGVLDNVLGDGNYFLDVSSPTYFGSQNDKFNLFISAVNIADSPLYSLISIGYNNGYDFGYGYGYNTGHQVGFADGEESGYNEGYDTGFENGFNEGRDTANPLAPVMSLFKDTADVVAGVLNVQILPNITIGTILLFPLVALLFALFVRLFFGG